MKRVFEKLGINYDIMKLIIKHKIIMDKRRGDGEKNYLLGSLIVYFIIGLFSVPIVAMDVNPMIKMTLFFSFFMIMILNVFITDFSSVILDVKDKEILLTKGIDNKTLNAAKFIHIMTYIGLTSIAISGGAIIVSLKYGISFTIVLLVNIFLIDIFMLVVSAIIYTTILKLFSGEKLKDMINAFQIAFLLVFVIGFQLVGRTFEISNLQFVYKPEVWNILVAPMWFAANFNVLLGEGLDNIIKVMSILSIVLPIVCLIIYLKMIPVFENNLQKLNDNSYKVNKSTNKLYQKVSNIICKGKEERIFFNFLYEVLNKDRDFKAKVYPSLAMAIFIPLLMMMSYYDKQGIVNYISGLRNSDYYFSAYLCVMLTQNVITLIKYSKEYEGAWIYNVLPIKDESNVYSAMFKVSMYKLILPIFIILGILFLLIFKINVLIDIFVVFVANIIVSMFTFKTDEKRLPFSIEYKNINSSSNIVTMLKSMLIVGILAVLHYIIRNNVILKVLYVLCLSILIKVMYKKILT